MTTGTKIIENALAAIGAHSPLQPANPESLEIGKDTLNAMLSEWQNDDILLQCVPLKVVGSELSEPSGARNPIIFNLAVTLAPYFPGSQVSSELSIQAKKGYNKARRIWKDIEVPKRKARGTYPRGQGRKTEYLNGYYWDETFFEEGQDVG